MKNNELSYFGMIKKYNSWIHKNQKLSIAPILNRYKAED